MSDARNEWIAQIGTLKNRSGNRKAINQQFDIIAAQAQANNPAKYYRPSQKLSTANIGALAQAQDLALRNADKLGTPTKPFQQIGDTNQTQPLPGTPQY